MEPNSSLSTWSPPRSRIPDPLHLQISQMPQTQQLVLRTATRKLFDKNYFDICTVDSLMKLTGTTERSAAYTQLRALHCVHYSDMPKDLQDRIPHLVRECLTTPTADECVGIVLG